MTQTQNSLFEKATDAQEGGRFWDEGQYVFRLVNIERAETKYDKPSNAWEFEVLDPVTLDPIKYTQEGEPCTIRQYATVGMGPDSKGRRFYEALAARKLVKDELGTLEEVQGKLMRGFIMYEPSKGNPGKEYPQLKSLQPFQPKTRKVPTVPPSIDLEEEL